MARWLLHLQSSSGRYPVVAVETWEKNFRVVWVGGSGGKLQRRLFDTVGEALEFAKVKYVALCLGAEGTPQ